MGRADVGTLVWVPTAGQDPPPQVEKRGTPFLPINHQARPLCRNRSNQREPLASPDSPLSYALLGTLLFPVGHAGEVQRQSRRSAGGAKAGWYWGIIGIGLCTLPLSTSWCGRIDTTINPIDWMWFLTRRLPTVAMGGATPKDVIRLKVRPN